MRLVRKRQRRSLSLLVCGKNKRRGALAMLKSVEEAKIVVLIETVSHRGNGTQENPDRLIREYWTLDGKKAGEYDCFTAERSQAAQ